MKSKFEVYCTLFKTNKCKMRALLHRYFGTPEYIRLMSIEEYSARQNNQLFQGREPRPYIDICIDLEMKK